MSTPAGSSQWMYTPASGFYPYLIDQSLRFNDNDSAYLSRTPASAGNRKTWTLSMWVKRANLGINTTLFSAGTASNNQTKIRFVDSDNSIFFDNEVGGSTTVRYYTSNLFRDVSSWYHFVFEVDTTQATDADKVKIYVNGEQVTSFSSTPNYPSLNEDLFVNNTNVHYIGRELGTGYLDAYLAEVHLIDGTALDATSFGETINGVWVPKAYDTADGAYGTNGFYLPFDDSAAIGDDESGNTNDWTANNLAASDVVSGESPTNNFAVFNPLDRSGTTLTYSEGNLKAENTSSGFAQAYSSFSFDSGKWYAEFLLDTGNTGVGVIAGTTNPGANRYMGQDSYTYGYYFDGRKVNNATYTAYGDSYTRAADGSGDVVGVYIDADNGDIYFSKNGTVQNSGTAAFTGVTGPFRFAIASESNAFHIANFGQDDSFSGLKTSGSAAASDDNGNGVFYDTIGLSGYLAPCSANLPEPAISPNAAEQADDYFNTTLFTANAGAQTITTGVDADLIWFKQRNGTQNHLLYDTVRGDTKRLVSNTTSADIDDDLLSLTFLSDGFSIDTSYTQNYVSWNWKAGGTAVSNTDGSITSSVSAAPDAGFSIVSWVSDGSVTPASFGHGLNSKPELIIIKSRDSVANWVVQSSTFSNQTNNFILLNTTGAVQTAGTAMWGTINDSIITFRHSANSSNGDDMIAYCFHSSDICKVGSYVGNGSADGPFVFTGFRPAWVIIKRTDSTGSWNIADSVRSPDNEVDEQLQANLSNAESTTFDFDFLSNGFKARTTDGARNASGGSYIYLAFAENPFKYSNAR